MLIPTPPTPVRRGRLVLAVLDSSPWQSGIVLAQGCLAVACELRWALDYSCASAVEPKRQVPASLTLSNTLNESVAFKVRSCLLRTNSS